MFIFSSIKDKVQQMGEEEDFVTWKQAAVLVSILVALGGVGWYGHMAQPHQGAVSESQYIQNRNDDRLYREEMARQEKEYNELQMKYLEERFDRLEKIIGGAE